MRDAINVEQVIAQLNLQIQNLKQAVFDLNRNRGIKQMASAGMFGGGTTLKNVTESVNAITELKVGDDKNLALATLQTKIMLLKDLVPEKKGKEDKYSTVRTLSDTIIGAITSIRDKQKQVQTAAEVTSEDIFDQAVQQILVASTGIFTTWNDTYKTMQIDLSQDNGQQSLFSILRTTAGKDLFKRFSISYKGNVKNALDFLGAVAAYKSNPTDVLRASIIDRYIADDAAQAIVCGPFIKQDITSFHYVLMSSKTDVRSNQGLIAEIQGIFDSNKIQSFDFLDGSRLQTNLNGDLVMSSSSPGAAAEPTEMALTTFSPEELNEVYEKLQTEMFPNPLMSNVADKDQPVRLTPTAPPAEISLKDKLTELYEFYKDESKQLIFNGYTLYYHEDKVAIAIDGQKPFYLKDARDDQLSKVIEDLQGYLEPTRRFDPETVGGQKTLPVGQGELDGFRGLRSSHGSTLADPEQFIKSFMIDKADYTVVCNGVEYNFTNVDGDVYLQSSNEFYNLNEFVKGHKDIANMIVREIKQNTSHVDRVNGASEPEGHSR
jgi:hypothetical protein